MLSVPIHNQSMAFSLETVVPWGRSFAEYQAMFNLTPTDLQQSILGCGDGPAAFNAVLTQQGGRVTSVDPIYQFTGADIRDRVTATYDEVISKVRQNQSEFVWEMFRDPEQLGQARMAAMETFLTDFEVGKVQGRYVTASLPELPFGDRAFDLALCSHLLFLYSPQLDADFHLAAIQALCRVAHAVRIFPLLELGSRPSRHLPAVLDRLHHQGYQTQIEKVAYEFQRGGNEMLVVHSP